MMLHNWESRRPSVGPFWMAFQIDAMSVSPDTTTKGGGPYVFIFLFVPLSSSYDPKRKGNFWGLKSSIFVK